MPANHLPRALYLEFAARGDLEDTFESFFVLYDSGPLATRSGARFARRFGELTFGHGDDGQVQTRFLPPQASASRRSSPDIPFSGWVFGYRLQRLPDGSAWRYSPALLAAQRALIEQPPGLARAGDALAHTARLLRGALTLVAPVPASDCPRTRLRHAHRCTGLTPGQQHNLARWQRALPALMQEPPPGRAGRPAGLRRPVASEPRQPSLRRRQPAAAAPALGRRPGCPNRSSRRVGARPTLWPHHRLTQRAEKHVKNAKPGL